MIHARDAGDVIDVIRHVRDLLGVVLVMTVNPGFGGQSYIGAMEAKVAEVAEMLDGYDCALEVDGGIGPSTVAGAVAAGADGLLIEVDPAPEQAVSDGDQSLTFDEFDALMAGLEPVAAAVGRSL